MQKEKKVTSLIVSVEIYFYENNEFVRIEVVMISSVKVKITWRDHHTVNLYVSVYFTFPKHYCLFKSILINHHESLINSLKNSTTSTHENRDLTPIILDGSEIANSSVKESRTRPLQHSRA